MYVRRLTLRQFRNYVEQTVDLGAGLNIFCGDNAEGKTNLLESLYVFGVGRSPRTTQDKDLVNFASNQAYIRADVVKTHSTHKVEIHFSQSKKRIAIDGMPISRLGELMGVVNVVYFSPDEMSIIKEEPMLRRRFLDISLSQQSKIYYYSLLRYNKILLSRNKLLKEGESLDDTLPVWEEQLAKEGARIIRMRREYVQMLSVYAREAHATLTQGKEILQVEYESQCDSESEEQIASQLLDLLVANRDKDKRLAYTTVGPHRDDIKLMVGDIDIRKFGSQGQQRTSALSLKLAELEIFRQVTGEYPILLLDDVLSELDDTRKEALMRAVSKVQTILTCTKYDMTLPRDARVFAVHQGSATMTN